MTNGRSWAKFGCVGRLNLAEIMEVYGKPEQDSPDLHLDCLLPGADGRKVRESGRNEAKLHKNSWHLLYDIHELSIRVIEVLAQAV